ncbi:hypothetical protein SAMN05660841_01694 [Sphingobacterium nematocida]|uniref:Uncharacterized protein n=1 Tax=Sphingobacterium nematocida TaxID=1513896 RepID=A0A1T5CZV3_9SPHI|nr:hypothetical protein [Sphingobacterium nematocida]SKB65015.1 hypothetical protein SAMN05660841_01694 [Sphingobacterium nematocida]
MKNSTIITHITLVILFTFSSCRTVKEKTTQQSYEREQAYTHWQHKYTEAFGWMDSTGRYWSFSTDSAFHYHPDSGIYAKQGLLSFWEDKLQKQVWTSIIDSNYTGAVVQQQHNLWKTYYRSIKDSKWGILIGLSLLVLGCYLLYRSW